MTYVMVDVSVSAYLCLKVDNIDGSSVIGSDLPAAAEGEPMPGIWGEPGIAHSTGRIAV